MNLESRLNKLEIRILEKHKEKGDIVLYNEYGNVVDAIVVKMPTAECEGLARLTDGTEQAIIYEEDWEHEADVWIYDPNNNLFFMDNEPVGQNTTQPQANKLFMRYSICNIVKITPASKDPKLAEKLLTNANI